MKNGLDELIKKFGARLTKSEYNQYVPKLKYLVKYLLLRKDDTSIEAILRHDFTRNDVIQSTVYYIENNDNVRSKSAVDDYLIALNRFFEETVYKVYPNHNLIALRPFTSLNQEVDRALSQLGMELNERVKFPALSEDEYKFILDYLRNDQDLSFKMIQVHIILKLFLLYGLSFDRVINLCKSNYIIEKRALEIAYQDSPRRVIHLEVPSTLHNEISEYLQLLNNKNIDNERLFVNTKGKSIKHDFPNEYLQKIRKSFQDSIEQGKESTNSFTPTGLSKFAIIRMLLEGVNLSVIADLTGFQSDVLSDCQNTVMT